MMAVEEACARPMAKSWPTAIEIALANHEGPTGIECIIDRDDCTPELDRLGTLRRSPGRPARPQ